MEVYLSGCKGQRELGIRCTIIFSPLLEFLRDVKPKGVFTV